VSRDLADGEPWLAFDEAGLVIYERVLRAFADSVPRIRRELSEALARHDVAADRRADIALFISEAATNAVLHAYRDTPPGPLYAAAALSGDSLTVWVSDFGCGMLPDPDHAGLGMGLVLMDRLADQVEMRPQAGAHGTCITARFAGIRAAATTHARCPHASKPASERRELLLAYVQALRATQAELRQDADAVLAQADLALAHARRLRDQRSQSSASRQRRATSADQERAE
jgi:serine/threonine-protein kinase RsbW/stage II sporulation protein AB (anti-sigma F factor)